jgi:hypothetical protein
MPRIDDVKESEAAKTKKLVRRANRATPGNNQSVTGGRTRFIGIQSLIVIGSQLVTGLLEVAGRFEGNGTILWRGSMKILGLGTLDVDGPATFRATLDVLAATRLRGKITLEDDMTLVGPGKIKVGTVTMGVTSNGRPGIELEGGILSSAEDRVALTQGSATVGVSETFAAMAFGASAVLVRQDGTTIVGPIYLPALPPISGVSTNVAVDPQTGKLGAI